MKNSLSSACTNKQILKAAAIAFHSAYLKAIDSKAGAIVVSNGKLEHRWLSEGKLITRVIGDAPKPLFIGAGSRKKRAR